MSAVALGTAAAGTLLFSLLITTDRHFLSAPDAAAVFALCWAIALVLVLFGSVCIGIPTTLILRWTRRESRRNYIAVGSVTGFVLALASAVGLGVIPLYYWVAAPGLVAGGLMGWAWWRYYRRLGHQTPVAQMSSTSRP